MICISNLKHARNRLILLADTGIRRPYYHLCSGTRQTMAKSKYEYVKSFECEDRCLPNSWLVVRLDGKGFHRFATKHGFAKPNDNRALNLMNRAAQAVLKDYTEICIAYGQSDEYSFVFSRNAQLYNRRGMKILTNVCSSFTSNYVFHWTEFFPDTKLIYPPTFDGRVVLYPTDENLRDYLSWRQADCHINNLYNTTFWALVQEGGLKPVEAEQRLSGTVAADKNEMLFSMFGINYNNEELLYRKGTTLVRKRIAAKNAERDGRAPAASTIPTEILTLNVDIIKGDFWQDNPEILGQRKAAKV